jgi:hypothetical protein
MYSCKKLQNGELHNFYSSSDIGVVISRRISLVRATDIDGEDEKGI